MLTKLPFSGFYESEHTANIDRAIERQFSDADTGCHTYVPEDFYIHMSCGELDKRYAKEYAEDLNRLVLEETGFNCQFTFESLKSPKEYNFTTDTIYASVPPSTVNHWFDTVDREVLAKHIAEKYTSYSGFMSFYDNTLDQWLKKPLEKWDHNELGTLFEAWLETHKGEGFDIIEKMMWVCHEWELDNWLYQHLPHECVALMNAFDPENPKLVTLESTAG